MKKKWTTIVVLLTLITILSGCFGEKKTLKKPPEDAEGEIKVLLTMEGYGEQFFNMLYGNSFNIKYPNTKLKVISIEKELDAADRSSKEKIAELIKKHKPDIVHLSAENYESCAKQEMLHTLEEIIQENKDNVKELLPGTFDVMRNKGNGKLCGLPTHFFTMMLFCNTDLLQNNGIELPSPKPTVPEVMNIAKRFPGIRSGKEQVAGLYVPGGIPELATIIGSTYSLQFVDPKGEKVTTDSPGWEKAFELTADAVRSKAVYIPSSDKPGPSEEGDFRNPFEKGNAALSLDYTYQLRLLNQPDKGAKKINFNIYPAPIDPSNPNESAHLNFTGILCILADSANKPFARQFVEFAIGPEVTKAINKMTGGDLLPLYGDESSKKIDGVNIESCYVMRPKSSGNANSADLWQNNKVPQKFKQSFSKLLEQKLKECIDKKKTSKQALTELQAEGQSLLVKARKEEQAARGKK